MLSKNIKSKYDQLQDRMIQIFNQLDPRGHDTLSMAPRHREELKMFIEGHYENTKSLFNTHKDALSTEIIDKNIGQLLTEELFQLDAAIRFIEVSFIRPRAVAAEAQILEATDRLCTEMFIKGVELHDFNLEKQPIGPIVALDATRSPAIWSEDTSLDIPSLFSNNLSYKAILPVICLPADIAHSPEFYPLLSHEVGHALDTALGISSKIIATFDRTLEGKKYWRKWMREIVADFYGIYFSGSAFGLSFVRFVSRYNLPDDLSQASKYPPISLRLHLIATTIKKLYGDSREIKIITESILSDTDLDLHSEEYAELNNTFESDILPRLIKEIIPNISFEKLVEQELKTISSSQIQALTEAPTEHSFIHLPSILTHCSLGNSVSTISTIDTFRQWHSQAEIPDWSTNPSNWQFIEHLTTLRPTFTVSGSKRKRPPIPLLSTHNNITFLGATNKSLAKLIQEAAPLRTKNGIFLPWKKISIFFASDSLLEQVIYDNSNLTENKATRDQAILELQNLFEQNPDWCANVTMYLFNGPAIFGSFWDSDEPGGRIHISPQLLAKDIGVCPSSDHLWITTPPSYEYESYQKHLESIHHTSTLIHSITID